MVKAKSTTTATYVFEGYVSNMHAIVRQFLCLNISGKIHHLPTYVFKGCVSNMHARVKQFLCLIIFFV